ncbi:TlyA family RNA methyltransferase [Methyloceanibacter caenitepidi]|uniref:RNA binding methyltransferase FtsJ like n=1 Tax=Methyloceanibacter caenitepidi TaxID=1384459 RepID=A0A0A8K1Z0_9HYPH|nr:TlyA family RNA methyltransferase [Methyloceanibacter caenitepidi]BAQ16542.1 RNA binding methyltransferase FtsJ like [Methyloceanibacter caenitepidi]
MASYRKKRIDQRLVEEGLAPSRAQAADLVRRGRVLVDGVLAAKPGAAVADDVSVGLVPGTDAHVSRGALKLEAALEAFDLSPEGCVALDVGASTGGFTEVLLARGAAKVYAVDVGRDQLHASLRDDPRVVPLEATDARRIDQTLVPEAVSAITADVSFISLTQALPAALRRAVPGAWLAALVKPQFEAGRDAVGKGGLVRDEADRQRAVARVQEFLAAEGWLVIGVIESPIPGGSGNVEYLIGARNDR